MTDKERVYAELNEYDFIDESILDGEEDGDGP